MTINGESIETGIVEGRYLATALKGKDPLDIEACHKTMNNVIYSNSSIKSVFENGLHK